MKIKKVAKLFYNFVGEEPPCNYNGMDEFTCFDDYCINHCDYPFDSEHDERFIKCWENAIKNHWLDGKEPTF